VRGATDLQTRRGGQRDVGLVVGRVVGRAVAAVVVDDCSVLVSTGAGTQRPTHRP
jgi:hypothetical protein